VRSGVRRMHARHRGRARPGRGEVGVGVEDRPRPPRGAGVEAPVCLTLKTARPLGRLENQAHGIAQLLW